jgi:hypothetical protein
MYRHYKNRFKKCKEVTWDDVIAKLSYEFSIGSNQFIFEDIKTAPSFLTTTGEFSGTLSSAFKELYEEENILDMHVYMSLGGGSSTFGRHNDRNDVLIVQSIGEMQYLFDDGNTITLTPGDGLFIEEGVYHTPIVPGPRVTLSSALWK